MPSTNSACIVEDGAPPWDAELPGEEAVELVDLGGVVWKTDWHW